MPLAIEKKKRRPRGGDAAEGSDGAPGKGKRPRQANVSSGAEESNADRRPKASRSAREPPRVTRDHKDEVAKKRVKKHKHVGRGELEGEEDVRPTKVEDEKDQRVGRAKMPLTRRLGMQREENSTSDEDDAEGQKAPHGKDIGSNRDEDDDVAAIADLDDNDEEEVERAEEVAGTNDDGDNDDEVVEGGEAEDEADVDETHDNGYDDVKTPSQRKRGRTSEEVNMEGLIIDDEMYLLDRAQGIVYSSSMGKLVKVGNWDPATKSMRPLDEQDEEDSREIAGGSTEEEEEEDDKDMDEAEGGPDNKTIAGARRGTVSGTLYPFAVDDDDDHCETSPEAYRDVDAILGRLADLLGKTREELAIYDPYYCTGQVVKHLGQLGFTNVYNKCEDFYKVLESGQIPAHDVVVTNPPYSADHMEKILRFCCERGKPWMLLLPNYVYMKEYFEPALRYYYWSPKGLARDNPKVRGDGRTSPFISFWYCHMSRHTEEICQWWNKTQRGKEGPGGRRVVLARSTRQLPLGAMDEFDPGRKKRKVMLDRGQRGRRRGGKGGGRGGKGGGRGDKGRGIGKGRGGKDAGKWSWGTKAAAKDKNTPKN